ncbi:MAG: hypothetical protein HGA90_06310 [Alphaproteobacteria bacterium]|nr:hypothetical protein [Alphaproteobacteria bacterium]
MKPKNLPLAAACLFAGGLILALATPSLAAKEKTLPAATEGQIEVTADKSLEWYQDTKLYVARGNAKATRGTMTIEADILSAHERDSSAPKADNATAKEGADPLAQSGNIDRLTAEGNVHLIDARQEVFGEHAVYDLDRKVATITGSNLKYATTKDVVTARDSLEYHEGKNTALARGKAIAVYDDRRVEADVLAAHFTSGATGQMEVSSMTAEGNVTVLTKTDVARGDKAVYDLKRNVAVLTGHVRITRADTQLSGDKAEVDFATGQSRLINTGKSGRVRALLTPKKSGSAPTSGNPLMGTP